jgi:endonuclease/exonuclease/phosphatase family metal-dependent hydrolase
MCRGWHARLPRSTWMCWRCRRCNNTRVVALQSLLHALDVHTGGQWRSEIDDCPDDARQHVGFIYDAARVTLTKPHMIDALNPYESACKGHLRPGYAAYAVFKTGVRMHVVTVHLDSGTEARDHGNRASSLDRLVRMLDDLRLHAVDDDVVMLGDFNTMGCRGCSPRISASEEQLAIDARLPALTPALKRLNNPLKCTFYNASKAALLDQVIVSQSLAAQGASLETSGLCGALSCSHRGYAAFSSAMTRLSDHCPVVMGF